MQHAFFLLFGFLDKATFARAERNLFTLQRSTLHKYSLVDTFSPPQFKKKETKNTYPL